MEESNKILLGVTAGRENVALNAAMLNRHGLIAGATGTGKTVTLQVIAEQCSKLGISVFLTDIKGDISGISKPIVVSEKIETRLENFDNYTFTPSGSPVNFIDTNGRFGHPLRVTPTAMGPLLLSRLLELNETQEGVMHIAFKYADENGLLLLDLKDLRSILSAVSENQAEIRKHYGNVNSASVAAIQRRLLVLEEQGASLFFGEPEFDIRDLLIKDFSGRGLINILDSTELFQKPKLYGSILLWLLSEVFETFEEVGDRPLPRLMFFFDEAHLLFDDLPKVLLERIETVVRLIRSKGVGVFFVTQNPDDVPTKVLSQVGNRIQHSLRSYTAADADRIKKISRTFKVSKILNIEEAITNLKVGEALVSVLGVHGEPLDVEKILVAPPTSRIGPISAAERIEITQTSPFLHKYSANIDRESAYEVLKKKMEKEAELGEQNKRQESESKKSSRQGPLEAFFISLARSVGSQIGRQILRGVLGTVTKK